MNWYKRARTEQDRIKYNIRRLNAFKNKVSRTRELLFATQSGGHKLLSQLAEERMAKIHDDISDRLHFLIKGENNQKVALDSPHRAGAILDEIEILVDTKIVDEQRKLESKNEWFRQFE